jgi:hypothetical protein
MNTYMKAFVVGGVVIPTVLHVLNPRAMPWWPDAATLGVAFGAVAIASVWQRRKEREMNSRIWNALKSFWGARKASRHRRLN